MKGKFRFGLFPKLLLTMLIVAVIPLVINWYVNRQSSIQRLTGQVDQLLSTRSDGAVRYIDTWIETNTRMLRQNAALEQMGSMDPKKQEPIMRNILKEYGWARTCHITGLEGHQTARGDDRPKIFLGDRQYIKDALSGSIGIEIVVSRTIQTPGLIVSVPIYDSSQRIVAALAMGTGLDSVSNTVLKVKIGKTGFAYLLNEKGQVVAHEKKELAMVDFQTNPAFKALGNEGIKKRVEFIDEKTEKKIISYAQRTKIGWVLVIQQDYDEAYAPIVEADRNASIVLGGTLFLVIIIAYLVASRLSRPILNLTKVADSISRGELGTQIKEVDRSDEIGELARAVDRLGTSMKLAIERLSKR